MSLQGLMSGADCAVEVNPLHQVLKHTEGDRGVQQVNPTPVYLTNVLLTHVT